MINQKQVQNPIQKYGLICVGLLFSLPLLFFGYYRIQTALRFVEDYTTAHYGRVGLLFMTLGAIILGVFFFVAVIINKREIRFRGK